MIFNTMKNARNISQCAVSLLVCACVCVCVCVFLCVCVCVYNHDLEYHEEC